MTEAVTNELRSLATKYRFEDANIISNLDLETIIEFIEWIEKKEA